jgi:hypothetical protein
MSRAFSGSTPALSRRSRFIAAISPTRYHGPVAAQEPEQEREDQVERELDRDRPRQRAELAEVGGRDRRGRLQREQLQEPANV